MKKILITVLFIVIILPLVGVGCSKTAKNETQNTKEADVKECEAREMLKMENKCGVNSLLGLSIEELQDCESFVNEYAYFSLMNFHCYTELDKLDDSLKDYTGEYTNSTTNISSDYILEIERRCKQKIGELTPKELLDCLKYFDPYFTVRDEE